MRVNGGYFAFKTEIFDYIGPGEELVVEPFERLVRAKELIAHEYDGFWMPMDTAKDKKRLDDLYQGGKPPWQVWRNEQSLPVSIPNDWRTPGSLAADPALVVAR